MTPEEILADTHRLRVERAARIAEDELRRRAKEQVPEIAAQVDRMEEALRELVDFERSKLPLGYGKGYVILKANKGRKKSTDPVLAGTARIAGKTFKAVGFENEDRHGEKFIKVNLLSALEFYEAR